MPVLLCIFIFLKTPIGKPNPQQYLLILCICEWGWTLEIRRHGNCLQAEWSNSRGRIKHPILFSHKGTTSCSLNCLHHCIPLSWIIWMFLDSSVCETIRQSCCLISFIKAVSRVPESVNRDGIEATINFQ